MMRRYCPDRPGFTSAAHGAQMIPVYRQLLAEEEKQTRTIASLCTRMRITQQSTYDPKQKKAVVGPRPWDLGKKGKD